MTLRDFLARMRRPEEFPEGLEIEPRDRLTFYRQASARGMQIARESGGVRWATGLVWLMVLMLVVSAGLGLLLSYVISPTVGAPTGVFVGAVTFFGVWSRMRRGETRRAICDLGLEICLGCAYPLGDLDERVTECPECGHERAESLARCQPARRRLADARGAPVSRVRWCSCCGLLFRAGQKRCVSCGGPPEDRDTLVSTSSGGSGRDGSSA